jgi:hypothetical protein
MSSARENRSASDKTTSEKPKRPCPFLFVLGCGASPGSDADDFARKFVYSSRQLDCGASVVIRGEAEHWDGDGKSSVAKFARTWLAERDIVFDEKRLLVRTYETAAGPLAVAGYVPKTRPAKASDDSLAAADASTGESPPAQDAADSKEEFEVSGESGSSTPPAVLAIVEKLKSIPPKKIAFAGGGVALLVLLAILVPMFIPDGEGQTADGDGESQADGDGDGDGKGGQPKVLPAPKFQTGVVRVYTGESGFHVLVDGEAVKDEEGNAVTTPCAVTTEVGSHTVTVFREGYFDASEVVGVTEDGEVTFTPLEDPDGANSDALKAQWRDAEIGKPIALTAVNSSRPELAPYLTSDGLSLWFVGDRDDGRGIFVSTRLSTFHEFGAPEQISKNADLPGTPSVTDDALLVVYPVPEKARLFSLTRDNPLGEFDKEPIRASDGLAPTWASAQILGDGLRIYWLEITDKKTRTLMSTRQFRDSPFGNLFEFTMPGRHPCLSQDGLRQYVFDGKRVLRYRRTAVSKTFGSPDVVASLDLPDFVPSERHRQIFVSHDEQWMFYCDDPVSGGDLFAVRLSDGPHWGVKPTGKSIPPKPVVVAEVNPEMKPADIPDKPVEKPIDPRSLPLPYTAHWKIFKTLIANRQYDELAGLIQNAKSNPAMKPFAEQLAWDEEELKQVQQFWADVENGVGEFKKGDSVRIANNRAEFDEFKDGTIHATRSGKPVQRKLEELRASELTQFYDKLESTGDAEGDYRAGVFLSHDRDGIERSAKTRMDRAGRLGETFRERVVRRLIAQAKGELERSKFGEGVTFIKQATPLAAGLPIADELSKLEGSLYGYVKWRQVGPRGWAIRGTSYEATLERKPGALLLSEIEYKNVEVSLEWKTENSMVAMGGVYFRYPGLGDPNDNSYKIQLANDFGIASDNFSTGALFKEEAAEVNAVKPAGEWNTLVLRAHGPDLVVTINGKKVLETVAVSPDKSKQGYVALDGVAGGITYRKILVSELPE